MASNQENETRINVLERKVDFLMKLCTVTKREESTIMPGEYIVSQMSLLDLYRELQATGGEIE